MVHPKSLGLSFSPSTFPLAFPFPFIFFFQTIFLFPAPAPFPAFLCPSFLVLVLFVFPALHKGKGSLRSQVIGAFSFYIPFTFQVFSLPLSFVLFLFYLFFTFLGEEKGSHKIDLSVHFLFTFHFPLAFPFPFIFFSLPPFKQFFCSPLPLPFPLSFVLFFLFYLFFPLLWRRNRAFKSQVICAFSFHIFFPF